MMRDMTSCRSCGAKMFFLTMESGRANPVDAEPAENGNIWIGEDGIGHVITKGAEYDAANGPLYMSHFATCPNAKPFKKAK